MWAERKRLVLLICLAVVLAGVAVFVNLWRGVGGSDGEGGGQALAGGADTGAAGAAKSDLAGPPRTDAKTVARIARLSRSPRPEDLPELRTHVRSPSSQVREMAVHAFARISEDSSRTNPRPADDDVQMLIERLRTDESAGVRIAAATSLGKLRCWEAGDALIAALEDSDPRVRARAGGAIDAIVGVRLGFVADDPDRDRVVQKIRNLWPMFYEGHLKHLADRRAGQ